MERQRNWSEQELLVAFRLYCRTPFGRLHQRNPEIIALAAALGRTPSAVAMKACNFASLDPVQQARGITALGNVSRSDRELWSQFEVEPDAVAARAEAAHASITEQTNETEVQEVSQEASEIMNAALKALGDTEREQLVRVRRVQGFFRASVLVSYEHRCAISGISVPALLNASHIIPWRDDVRRRADPRNGICLNALYDRAFDRGLISFDESLRVMVSPTLATKDAPPLQTVHLLNIEGCAIRPPTRFAPDAEALAWHRDRVFRATA